MEVYTDAYIRRKKIFLPIFTQLERDQIGSNGLLEMYTSIGFLTHYFITWNLKSK